MDVLAPNYQVRKRSEGKFDAREELLHSAHTFQLGEGDIEGIPSYRKLLEGYYHALNPTFEIEHVIGEGDFAALQYIESGVFSNDWPSAERTFKATGQKYSTFGVELIKIKDGKIIEAWPGHDSLTHYTQIGLAKWIDA